MSDRLDDETPRADIDVFPLFAVGVDHRSAPLPLREKVALDETGLETLLLHLMARPDIAEALALSTCNRTELYVVAHESEPAFRASLDLGFAERAPEIERQGRFFVLHDRDAARRFIAIATGLESMVLGEPEIFGQVKDAGRLATRIGSAGPVLERLMAAAVQAGKRARSETEIGEGAVSLGYAAVELSSQIFADVEARTTLILGAGETARIAARALADRGVRRVLVANRNPERAAELIARFPVAERVTFADRREHLIDADVVVASTAADDHVVTRDDLAVAMRERPSRPLLVVDLGVPRNVEPAVRELENVFLHDLDSLEQIVDRNLGRRRRQIPAVERIVTEELGRFEADCRRRDAEPVVAELQRRAEHIRRAEVERVRDRFPPDMHEELEVLTRSLVRKVLHHPSTQLRSGGDREPAQLELVRELFQLEDDE